MKVCLTYTLDTTNEDLQNHPTTSPPSSHLSGHSNLSPYRWDGQTPFLYSMMTSPTFYSQKSRKPQFHTSMMFLSADPQHGTRSLTEVRSRSLRTWGSAALSGNISKASIVSCSVSSTVEAHSVASSPSCAQKRLPQSDTAAHPRDDCLIPHESTAS